MTVVVGIWVVPNQSRTVPSAVCTHHSEQSNLFSLMKLIFQSTLIFPVLLW